MAFGSEYGLYRLSRAISSRNPKAGRSIPGRSCPDGPSAHRRFGADLLSQFSFWCHCFLLRSAIILRKLSICPSRFRTRPAMILCLASSVGASSNRYPACNPYSPLRIFSLLQRKPSMTRLRRVLGKITLNTFSGSTFQFSTVSESTDK